MTLKNTEKRYKIIIRNDQTIGGESNIIEETAVGNMTFKNGKCYIRYSIDDEGAKLSSIIIVQDSEVIIRRHGNINSSIVYKAGEVCAFSYETPYGVIEISVRTDKLFIDLKENDAFIRLIYTLEMQGESYFNDLKITAKEI